MEYGLIGLSQGPARLPAEVAFSSKPEHVLHQQMVG